MRLFPLNLAKEQKRNEGRKRSQLYLNVYDLTPMNNYLYWCGLGIFHSGIEVHGVEYGYGTHEYPCSGIFEVKPRSCPGFTFRRSIPLGSTDISQSEFLLLMKDLSSKYHGDKYHLIDKNCNHFADEACLRLTGKHIPGWVNRLAKLASFCKCLLPQSIPSTAVRRRLPDHPAFSEDDGLDYGKSFVPVEKEDQLGRQFLTTRKNDMAFLKDKPVRPTKELL